MLNEDVIILAHNIPPEDIVDKERSISNYLVEDH